MQAMPKYVFLAAEKNLICGRSNNFDDDCELVSLC